eukprot:scaffold70678_cov65-Phaeocystis_antarctica.AAC.4
MVCYAPHGSERLAGVWDGAFNLPSPRLKNEKLTQSCTDKAAKSGLTNAPAHHVVQGVPRTGERIGLNGDAGSVRHGQRPGGPWIT